MLTHARRTLEGKSCRDESPADADWLLFAFLHFVALYTMYTTLRRTPPFGRLQLPLVGEKRNDLQVEQLNSWYPVIRDHVHNRWQTEDVGCRVRRRPFVPAEYCECTHAGDKSATSLVAMLRSASEQ